MATLGSLVVSLEANIAKFQSDLGRAVTMAESSMNTIAEAAGMASEALGLLGIGFGVEKIREFAMSTLEATARLGQLSAQSGLSVEALSSIRATAAGLGMDIEQVATSFDKMEKQASAAAGGNVKTAQAFGMIGLSVKDLTEGLKDPDELFLKLAQGLEKFADDGNKTALMMTLLGKGGAQMNMLLHDVTKSGYDAADSTAEQAHQAEIYEKNLAQWSTALKAWTRDVTMAVIPGFILMNDTIEQSFSLMWINIKYDFQIALSWMGDQLNSWVGNIGAALQAISAKGSLMYEAGQRMKDSAGSNSEWDAGSTADLMAQRTAALAENAKAAQQSADDYLNRTQGPAIQANTTPPKPSVGSFNAKPLRLENSHNDLNKEMDERLKIIQAAMKNEDEVYKLGNQQLDSDYDHAMVSLADWSTQKANLLQKNFDDTQALYNAEIALAMSYVSRLQGNLDKLKGQTVDPTQTAQQAAKIAAAQSQLESASDKVIALTDAKTLDLNKHLEDGIALTEKAAAASAAYANSIVNLDISYATMIGDTAKANQLQTDQADALLKTRLEIDHNASSLAKLAAVEEDRRMRASQDGADGFKRALIDYQKMANDTGTQIASMTTKWLGSMTDALVTFTMTGKLNWRGMIDSMIADIMKLIIQQQISAALASGSSGGGGWLGMLAGAFLGGGTSAGGGSGSNMMAAGGAVSPGNTYTVGERGPEQFVPTQAGVIIPNGAGGQQSGVVYAPTIKIDSRSDRAQVQADTAAVVRQGQRELVALLVRYNPGLRI